MNRRGFLKLLAAIPLVRHLPLPARIYGDGSDGDVVLRDQTRVSPYDWVRYGGTGQGGGGGGGLVMIRISVPPSTLKITARGGAGARPK